MSLLIAISLLVISIFTVEYIPKGCIVLRFSFKRAALLVVRTGLFIGGGIMLFIAEGWKWGLFGILVWLALLGVKVRVGESKYLDRLRIDTAKVEKIEEQHSAELENFWESTSPDECANLMVNFLDRLRLNYPREFLQTHPDRLPNEVSTIIKYGIEQAYKVGYMCGKGWVSQEQLADRTLNLGVRAAAAVRLYTTEVKSDESAFAVGFNAVAAVGHLKVTRARPEDS